MRRHLLLTFVALGLLAHALVAAPPLLLQKPSLSRTQIVFTFAGDLWLVSRDGGEARRLTTGPGMETEPFFSPDGSMIAFTGEYDGNVDIFVVPAGGGVPRRLTWHPSLDQAAGWTPDGKHVLFCSSRHSYARFRRLFTVPVERGFPAELPLPMGIAGSYSADGSRIAYLPIGSTRPPNSFDAWKRYRGGRATAVWIARLSDSGIVKVPRTSSNDSCPQWIGDTVYFLSDRSGPVTLFSYNTRTKKLSQLIRNDGFDIRWATAGPGAIVYEQFGEILLYNLKSGKTKKVDITLAGDLPEVRPRFEKAKSHIRSVAISPTGARAVLEARGEILTVPAKKGDPRNLTSSPGVHERSPAWSPDGRHIAFFSDASGEYELHVCTQDGMGEPRRFSLGDPPGFYSDLSWSPDSKKLLFLDNRLNIWFLDLDQGQPVKVDTDTYYEPLELQAMGPVWSGDSRWIAYTRLLGNYLRAVFAYSLETGETHQLTDGMSDARYAAFDTDGKHLYFTASTDAGLTAGWLDMSSSDRAVTRSVYVIVLRKDLPSPIAPESDEEKGDEKGGDKDKQAGKAGNKKEAKAPAEVRIDFDNIGQRILALPIPPRNYVALRAGASGVLFVHEGPVVDGKGSASRTLHKFDLKERKLDKFIDNVDQFDISHNGEKILYSQKNRLFIAGVKAKPKPGEGELKLDAVEVRVDPCAEWKQMYDEVWRIQREFFYDPNLHGLDWEATSRKYSPYVDGIASRVDLNYLFEEMLGHISVGHLYIRGGRTPEVKRVKVGLLGADYAIENGRYRFARVYSGENWNPRLRAPLTQPGVNVVAGEYLLAVNGREVLPPASVFSFFEATAGKSVVLKVGPNPGDEGSREVTVVPIDNEQGLRNRAWIEDNRRKVEQLSDGRVAYVYLPDTAQGGYTNFNRYYFAQSEKQGAVIDERFNGGGSAADYIVDYLHRPLLNYWSTRYGKDFTTPARAIFGPKAMIINEYAGSGGDALPWYFRKLRIGPLVGKRTWGGLVGILGFPPLMDGGSVTAPNVAFWNLEGEWDVENHGVAPDVEVEFDPELVRQGRDPQLEKSVELVLEELEKNPPPVHSKPAFPDHNSPARNPGQASSHIPGQPEPTPRLSLLALAPTRNQPAPTPAPGQPAPTPAPGQPAPTPAPGQPARIPARGQPGLTPAPAQLARIPARGQPAPSVARGQPAPSVASGQPAPTPALGQLARIPATVHPSGGS